jgi:hypothetical protein
VGRDEHRPADLDVHDRRRVLIRHRIGLEPPDFLD